MSIFSNELLQELRIYIECHRENAKLEIIKMCSEVRLESSSNYIEMIAEEGVALAEYIKKKRKPSFREVLFQFIDDAGMIDSDVYKKAEIDRRHFSKIRSNGDYRPSKNTVVALALALKLNKGDTDILLSAAGYSLSESDTFDLIIQFCIEKKIHAISDVNRALVYFSFKPLGGVE